MRFKDGSTCELKVCVEFCTFSTWLQSRLELHYFTLRQWASLLHLWTRPHRLPYSLPSTACVPGTSCTPTRWKPWSGCWASHCCSQAFWVDKAKKHAGSKEKTKLWADSRHVRFIILKRHGSRGATSVPRLCFLPYAQTTGSVLSCAG